MELKSEHKHTVTKIVPTDWEVSTIGDVTKWVSGGTPNRGNAEYWEGSIPWISGSTLKSLEISTSDQFLTEQGVEAGSKMAPINATLLLVRGSALHSCIRAGLVVAPVSFNQDVKALIPDRSVNPKYLTIYLLAMENSLLKLVSSAGNSAGVLDTGLVKNFVFFKPPRHEQDVIVEAISDMDALIQSLEQQIIKKQQIKQGAMQTLLNPYEENRKLKQGWVKRQLSSIANVIDPHPSHRAPPEAKHGIPFLGIGDFDEHGNIISKNPRIVSSLVHSEHSERYDLTKNLIGLGRVASIGKVIRLQSTLPFAISPTLGVIEAVNVDSEFLYQALQWLPTNTRQKAEPENRCIHNF
ncbi:restriction endonuclease subunit S [Endozoicomonas sp. ALB115]|uniref:restriction endonuclease subunit S n=1 Tax=Endozoicomonas sp. ALB115 TaxID=3403074 RepID=UPI003BB76FA2